MTRRWWSRATTEAPEPVDPVATTAVGGASVEGPVSFGDRTGSRAGVGGLAVAYLAGMILGLGAGVRGTAGAPAASAPAATAATSPSLRPTGGPSADPTAGATRAPTPGAGPIVGDPWWPATIRSIVRTIPADAIDGVSVLPPQAGFGAWTIVIALPGIGAADSVITSVTKGMRWISGGNILLTSGSELGDWRVSGPGISGVTSYDGLGAAFVLTIDDAALAGDGTLASVDEPGGWLQEDWMTECGDASPTGRFRAALADAVGAALDSGFVVSCSGVDPATARAHRVDLAGGWTSDPLPFLGTIRSEVAREGGTATIGIDGGTMTLTIAGRALTVAARYWPTREYEPAWYVTIRVDGDGLAADGSLIPGWVPVSPTPSP